MTTHWIAGTGSPNARVMYGNAKLTDESNGTTSVPSATTRTPKPGWETSKEPGRITRTWLRSARRRVSDGLLQRRRSLEAHGLAGLYLDRLAGARVEPLARLGLAHGKGPEARQRELAGFLQLLDDRVHQIACRAVGRRAGQFGRILKHLGNEGFRHAVSPLDQVDDATTGRGIIHPAPRIAASLQWF